MPKAEHKVRKHHPFSPSKLQILEACPKFKGLEGSNEAAERGTMMHEASETLDFSKLNQEETEAVHDYLDFIAACKDQLPGCEELTEIRVAVDSWETTAGFLDKALISEDKTVAWVIDLKTGYGDIEDADNNLQGMAYGIGIRRLYPTVQTVKVSFYMPRQARKESTHEFTAVELDSEYARIVAIVKRAKRARYSKGFDMAVPHTSVCRFCAHYTKCPKVAGLVTEVSKHMPIRVFSVEEMATCDDPEKLGQIMDMFKFLDEFSKPVKSRILAIAKSGGEVKGYSLTCIAEREVVDEAKVVELVKQELVEGLGVPEDKAGELVSGCYSFSLPAAESVISDQAPKGAKMAAKGNFREKLRASGAVLDSTPKVFLKRSAKADPLPAITFGAGGAPFGLPLQDAPSSEGANGKLYFD